MRKIG
jgi:hypothetical protein